MKTQLEAITLKMCQSGMSYPEAVAEFKKAVIQNALKECSGHQVNAAQHLGMHRNSLARLVAELRLDAHDFRPAPRRPTRPARLQLLTSKSS